MRSFDKKDFRDEIISKYNKLYGAFKNDDQLTKKEYRSLANIEKFIENKEKKKVKKRLEKECQVKQSSEDCGDSKADYIPRKQRQKLSNSSCKQRIAIDLSYMNEDMMGQKDLRMCAKQVARVYSENRKLPNPLQLHLTSVADKAKEILSYNSGFVNWDIHKHEQSYEEAFDPSEVIYLTSDSENVITNLDESKVYIIGGLLDHNSKKGLSLNRAENNKVSHGRLPIDEYMEMKKLKVLPINHVYSIMASVTGGLSWTEAFVATIPQRKEAKPKSSEEKLSTEQNSEEKSSGEEKLSTELRSSEEQPSSEEKLSTGTEESSEEHSSSKEKLSINQSSEVSTNIQITNDS